MLQNIVPSQNCFGKLGLKSKKTGKNPSKSV
jgi:hypothetical protein